MSSDLVAFTGAMSQVVAAIALVSGGLALAVTRRPALALGILLDLLVAAGLLRLVGSPSWSAIASAAVIIALRHLVSYGVRLSAASWRGGSGPPATSRGQGLHRALRAANSALHPAWRA